MNKKNNFLNIVLYQPDIPQNTGTIIRTGACLGFKTHIIRPCGFLFSEKKFRRSHMDYLDDNDLKTHESWEEFLAFLPKDSRLILLTTKTDKTFFNFLFQENDYLIFGRESAGVPEEIHESLKNKLTIPMREGQRSLNLAISVGIVASEALRQIKI